ncbi:MAG TPA: ATP-binding protein [Gemmatimonadaceae bacterium]|nr:ATP-binding protein [Gemmatimonadaceae bacterium]
MTSHERQVTRLALAAPLPALAVALWLLWRGDFAARAQWTLSLLLVGSWLALAFALRERVVRPLQTLSNMLAAIREQDYSLRARRADANDALGLAMLEVNTLMDELRERRLGALEATALLRRVMAEIDVAVLAFDDESGALRVVNAAGERLLGQSAERLLGRRAAELGLAQCITGEAPRVVELALGGQRVRWELRRGAFRQGGRPHQFVVLADVSRALRDEERLAWQRLVRVLGHEINNSLTPIRSLAERLRELLQRAPRDGRAPSGANGDLREDLERGLGVITSRSEALTRFLAAYTRLARLPPPRLGPVDVSAWVHRTARLETRMPVTIVPGPPVMLQADGDQLDQLLINLVVNAVDAALETKGGVCVRWARAGARFELVVEDDGPGLPGTANLFVPFFTTKPGGTGIGLVLSRQIAEAHGGTLTLAERHRARGSEARLVLAC